MTNDDKSIDLLGVKPIAKSIEKVTKGAVDGAAAFLSRICLPAAEEFGLLLQDKVSNWRAHNAISIIGKSEKLLDDKLSKSVLHAHPRLVYAALENGSWSDDDHIQSFRAGLLASSCTADGADESNLIFINMLSQLTASQGAIIEYACLNCVKRVSPAGWLLSDDTLMIKLDELRALTGIDEFHRLDRELDHLRSLDLIHVGFYEQHTDADLQPTPLCLQLFVRCQGYVGSPTDYFGIDSEELTSET